MTERLTLKNIQENPYASYWFRENCDNYQGKRFYLKKIKEEKNAPEIKDLIRREKHKREQDYLEKDLYLVYFNIEKILPLIGDGESNDI